MDDGKAAGPKLKWWSRPGRTPATGPCAEAGPQTVPPAGGPADAARADASGQVGPGAQDTGDWLVRPPQPRTPAAHRPPAPDGTAGRTGTEAATAPSGADGAERAATAVAGRTATAGAGRAEEGPAERDLTSVPSSAPAQRPVSAEGRPESVEDRPAPAEDRTPAGHPAAPGVEMPGADGARAGAATVTLGQVPAPEADRAPRAPDTAQASTAVGTPAAPSQPQTAAPVPEGAAPARPLHPEDPYGTPPYGGPGPWAPAPPVQRPEPRTAAPGWSGATPAQGTALPPAAGPLPPYGAPAPAAGYPSPPQAPPHTGGEPPHRAAPAEAAPPGPAPGPSGPSAEPDGPGHLLLAKSGAPQAPASQAPAPQPAPEGADTGFVPVPGDGGPRPTAAAPATAPPHAAAPGGHGPVPHGAWHQYDPWSAPLQGGPAASPRGPRSRRGLLAVGAVGLALLAGGVGGGVGAYVERYGGINDIKLPQAADDAGGRRPDSVAGIAQAALPGVVTIHVRGNAEQGTGTGFVLDRQGHILTNNHVVEPAGTGGEISVTFSGGQTAKAKVVGQDGGYDLAVVQVEGVTGLRPLPLGNSDSVRVGDPVVAIGAPFDLANTVTSGIISAKQRPITAGGEKGDGSDVSYVDALQTDAPINPGNSGGPLVDARARVIGINSAIRAADTGSGSEGGGQGGSIGLGFAIPINQAKRVAEELINTGRATHPVIGVTLEMEYAGDGARVSEHSKGGKEPVTPGGPGAKAGIRAGDVITEVDGAAVHSGEELIVKIRSHRPGDTLLLTLQRDGKQRSVRLTLGSSTAG
ncbi:trypsin-like peptidase domain-containing protein [Streptomyces lydicus]|uniref:S1C family serine protease n=1 Tax=Streptomyces lydicus TaxID=47763 RepID=UPI0037B6FD4B